jgi:hypothetical protein
MDVSRNPGLTQLQTKRLAGTCQPRLDRPDGHAEGKRNFLVTEPVNLSEHYRRSLVERQSVERTVEARRQLLLSEEPIRRRLTTGLKLAVRGNVLIQGNLIGAVAAAPETMPIARLVHGNAVNPRPQRRLTSESVNGAEDAEEHFLGQVQSLVTVAEQVHRQLNHHPLVFGDELRARKLIPFCTPQHKSRFSARNLGPTADPCLFHRQVHYTSLDP